MSLSKTIVFFVVLILNTHEILIQVPGRATAGTNCGEPRQTADNMEVLSAEVIAEVAESAAAPPLEQSDGVKICRDFKITKQLVMKYGETDGCPGCQAPRREHSQTCRKKMEESMASDPEQIPKLTSRDRRHGLLPKEDV